MQNSVILKIFFKVNMEKCDAWSFIVLLLTYSTKSYIFKNTVEAGQNAKHRGHSSEDDGEDSSSWTL